MWLQLIFQQPSLIQSVQVVSPPLDGAKANLFLQVRLPEGQQEPLDVLGAQAVDAARVDGPAQELVHLVLRVHAFLRVPENEMPESQKTEKCPNLPSWEPFDQVLILGKLISR